MSKDIAQEHALMMRDALDHITKTAANSRTSTRRIRWIELRAHMAINGEVYSDASFSLPKDGGENTVKRLKLKLKHITRALNGTKSALLIFMERVAEPEDSNCSCHISPPCNDCVENSGLREAFEIAKNAVETADKAIAGPVASTTQEGDQS